MKWSHALEWLEWGVLYRVTPALAAALALIWGSGIGPRTAPGWMWASGAVLLAATLIAGLRWWWRTR